MTLKEIKSFLKAGQKHKILNKLEDLSLNALSAQGDSRGIKKASRDMEKLLDQLNKD